MAAVDQKTGKQLGIVRDVCMDSSWRIKGLIIENKGLFRKAHYVPLEQLHIGEDAVMVNADQGAHPLPEGMYTLYTGEGKLAGRTVMTKDGDGLGQIHDVYFLEEMGNLIGCELSDGLLSDLRHGRKFVPWSQDAAAGEDVIFLPAGAQKEAAFLEPTNGAE